jgi:hypothetical protein
VYPVIIIATNEAMRLKLLAAILEMKNALLHAQH